MISAERLRANRWVRAAYNTRTVLTAHRREAARRPVATLRFLLSTPELSNWTYELENAPELLALAATAVGRPPAELQAHARELEADAGLRTALRGRLAARRDRSAEPHYGKRAITYALVRSQGPTVVAESGTHDGLGSAVIAAALRRNAAEGRPGRLLTFDINPDAGWLLGDEDRELVTQHVGPTSETLPAHLPAAGVDLFLHDSLRTVVNERREYDVALSCVRGPELLVVCDDVRTTPVLEELCASRGVGLTRLPERPARHWWPGNVLGLALVPAMGAQPG